MSETYCGKSCAECAHKEELNCPGCLAGPGKRYYGDCSLAKCCADRGHRTCETCQNSGHCGTYRSRASMPEQRIKRRDAELAERKRLAKRAPILGKWLSVLFWLVIPSTVASLMTNENIASAVPALFIPGMILQALTVLAYVIILLQLSKLEPRYQTAAVCYLLGSGATILLNLFTGGENAGWTLLITIPAAIMSMVAKYNEFNAHSEVLVGVDSDLCYQWSLLWKWYIGCYAAILGSVLLIAIAALLGALVMLAAAIGIVVVSILEMVYLYKTANRFRLYAALPPVE